MFFRLDDDDRHDDAATRVAHELRTPLTTIVSVTEILSDNPDLPAAQRETFVAMLAEEAERLQATVDRMISVSSAGRDRWCVDIADLAPPAPDA